MLVCLTIAFSCQFSARVDCLRMAKVLKPGTTGVLQAGKDCRRLAWLDRGEGHTARMRRGNGALRHKGFAVPKASPSIRVVFDEQ